MPTIITDVEQSGQWAIVELFGHKVVAGYITKDESFGAPLLRIDVPETTVFPAFTQRYGLSAIYGITCVSEEVARAAAQANVVDPVSVYVPDLAQLTRLRQEVAMLRKGLPGPPDDDDEDDD